MQSGTWGRTALEYENIPPDHPGEDHCSEAMLLDRQTDLTLALAQWETFLLKVKVYRTFDVRSAVFSSSVLCTSFCHV